MSLESRHKVSYSEISYLTKEGTGSLDPVTVSVALAELQQSCYNGKPVIEPFSCTQRYFKYIKLSKTIEWSVCFMP